MRASEFIWENFADSKNQQLVRAYHGNQGGIDVEDLVTPMWFTTSREDAEYYAGDDGYVVVVDLDIKNPYMIQVGVNNPHSALDRWKELQSQGYDGIYDRRLGDWIPFSKEQIRVIGVNNMLDENSADGEASGGLPVKTLKGLYHVGTLDASKKRDGYEGAGLSVSTHPDAWERIARGHVTGDTYSATKEGNRFLDAHSLTKKHNAEITQWAIKNGYLEQQETVTVCYYDDEMEDNLCQTFDSMADAKNEYDDELQYMDVTVDKDGIVPTEKLKKETRQTRMSATGILEYVLPIFAEQQGLDGVWWQDKLDVQRYSAPRGVIVPSKIKSWKFTVNENFADGFDTVISPKYISDVKKVEWQSKAVGVAEGSVVSMNDNFNTIYRLVKQFWTGDESSSSNAQKLLEKMGWEIYVDFDHDEIELNKGDNNLTFSMDELQGLLENYKDGKVKGKSRPGRFKRAGVSCKGSVTDLRKKAKNSSGEKQKGYHWCANMKSGKKK